MSGAPPHHLTRPVGDTADKSIDTDNSDYIIPNPSPSPGVGPFNPPSFSIPFNEYVLIKAESSASLRNALPNRVTAQPHELTHELDGGTFDVDDYVIATPPNGRRVSHQKNNDAIGISTSGSDEVIGSHTVTTASVQPTRVSTNSNVHEGEISRFENAANEAAANMDRSEGIMSEGRQHSVAPAPAYELSDEAVLNLVGCLLGACSAYFFPKVMLGITSFTGVAFCCNETLQTAASNAEQAYHRLLERRRERLEDFPSNTSLAHQTPGCFDGLRNL